MDQNWLLESTKTSSGCYCLILKDVKKRKHLVPGNVSVIRFMHKCGQLNAGQRSPESSASKG